MFKGSGHIFSEIFLHLNWHCLKDQPLILPAFEPTLHEYLTEYCRKEKGIHFRGIGGTETHVHLVIQMEPFVPLCDFIGRIKGASSHELNTRLGRETLHWQRGYGIVSFSKKHLKGVQEYVAQQKRHHCSGTVNKTLEEWGDAIEGQAVGG